MVAKFWLGVVLACAAMLGVAGRARAEIIHAPIGGRGIALGEGRVACEGTSGEWSIEQHGRQVKPPPQDAAIGHVVDLKVAPTQAGCDKSEDHVTLVAIDKLPVFDTSSVVFAPDEGRLDAEGGRLIGVTIAWKSGQNSGFDACRDIVGQGGGGERCTWGVGRNASADPTVTTFSWLPRGAKGEPEAVFYDPMGRRLPPETFRLVPSRIIISRLVPADAAVDLATGQGEIPLVHPEAVGSADCGQLSCEMSGDKLIVRGTASLVSSVELRLRLVPHVFVLRKDQPEAQVSMKLPVLHCPMSIASGPPIRNNDDAKVIVKLEGRCARDLSNVRFVTREGTLKILQTLNERDATYVLLHLGDVGGDNLTISAVRGESDQGIALAVAYTPVRSAPQVRAVLELPKNPNVGFIPSNRWTTVQVSPAGEHQHFAILPIEGVYAVQEQADGPSLIRAEPYAAGLTGLRFGLRTENLPAGLDQIDLAVVQDPLQRGMREANIPAPIMEPGPDGPLIEFLCGGGSVPLRKVDIGVTEYLTYDLRDTCRIVFHRERLNPEFGTQRLNFEVDILKPDGFPRGEAHIGEVVTFRSGKEPRYAWIRGITDPFDRVRIRISHVADENHYIGAEELRTGGSPAAQWSAVMGASRVRLYGTSTIPTGLYRFGPKSSSGVLSLNFGVISRLVYLDKEGKEFPIGFESGVLVFGVVNSTSPGGQDLRQVGVVGGFGFAVPISNRGQLSQASINLHAWGEVNVMRGAKESQRYAFIFGPSISIGNVGTNL